METLFNLVSMVGTLIASALGILQLTQLVGDHLKSKQKDDASPPVKENASTDDVNDC